MKVAFDHQIFSRQGYGGISRYFIRLAEKLSDLGERPKIFSPVHRNHYLNSHPDFNNGFFFDSFISKSAPFINGYNQMICGIQIAKWNPDVVHETYYSRAVGGTSTPTVTTIHDMIPELVAAPNRKDEKLILQKRNSVERADHIICVSENTKNDLLEIYNNIQESKVSVVYHGFELSHKTGKIVSNEHPYSGQPFLLYVGNRGGYKNFSKFLEAFAASEQLKNEFHIIAFGGGAFSKTESDMLKGLGIIDNVHQTSGDDKKLEMYYRTASALVFPSLYEGFGIPLLEAMASGCPVIASNTGSIPEIAGKAAEYFDPQSPESIRFSLENFLNSETARTNLVMQGLERIKKFSWEKCAMQTREVYKKLTD